MRNVKDLQFKKTNREMELEKDYSQYNLPKKIIDDSIKIYMTVMQDITLKRGNRRAMMCKCTYEAYKQNNIKKDPIFLAKKFDITVKQLTKSQNDFYTRLFIMKKLKKYPKEHFDAFDLLRDIAENMNYKGDKYEEMEEVIEKMYQEMELLVRISPREIAIACIHYFKCYEGDNVSFEQTEKSALIAHTKLVSLNEMIGKQICV